MLDRSIYPLPVCLIRFLRRQWSDCHLRISCHRQSTHISPWQPPALCRPHGRTSLLVYYRHCHLLSMVLACLKWRFHRVVGSTGGEKPVLPTARRRKPVGLHRTRSTPAHFEGRTVDHWFRKSGELHIAHGRRCSQRTGLSCTIVCRPSNRPSKCSWFAKMAEALPEDLLEGL